MPFERFTQAGRGFAPVCSVRANGQLGFNRGVLHHYKVEGKHAELYYDRERQLVGIKPVSNQVGDELAKIIVRNGNAYVAAKSFFEYYGIKYGDKTRAYSAQWSEEDDMIVFDLKKPLPRGRNRASEDEI